VVALSRTGWNSARPFDTEPRIFLVSVSIFSSSPAMCGISGARDRLQRRDHRRLEPKLTERRKDGREHDGRTIRIRDDAPVPPAPPRLRVEERQVVRVHLRDEERDVGLHPIVARVTHDDVSGLRERAFDLAGDGGIEPGEDEPRRIPGRGRLHDALRHIVGKRTGQAPRRGVAKRLAFRTRARAEPLDVEPGMAGKQGDELLADHAGRAENADWDHCPRSKKKPTREIRVGRVQLETWDG
jgi:hypothetical protein